MELMRAYMRRSKTMQQSSRLYQGNYRQTDFASDAHLAAAVCDHKVKQRRAP